MNPIKLTVQGLYSYQEKVEIDFERLTEGRLFGIFGKVGSGKSALLEAITFALYGQTERMSASGRNYNMMNLKSNQLHIDYEFSLENKAESDRFRFEVLARRNSKQFDKINTYQRNAYRWVMDAQKQNGSWVPMASNDATEILGLSYQNFTKTIIIPQGKFKDFLHLTTGDRSKMLKELFDLQRFDLHFPTKKLMVKAKEELATLEGQLKELPLVEENKIKEDEIEQTRIKLSLEGWAKEITALEKGIEKQNQIRDISAKMGEVQVTLDFLSGSEADFKALEIKLQNFLVVKEQFEDLLKKEKQFRLDLPKLENKLATWEVNRKSLETQINSKEQSFKEAKQAFDQREKLMVKKRELETMMELLTLKSKMMALGERLANGEEHILRVEGEKEGGEKEIGEVDEKLQLLKVDLKQLVNFNDLSAWYLTQQHIEEAHAAQIVQVNRHADRLQATQQAQATWLRQALLSEISPDFALTWDQGPKAIAKAITDHEAQRKHLQTSTRQVELELGLADFAARLDQGQSCPLCGSTEHPKPFHSETAQAQLQLLNQQSGDLATSQDKLQALLPEHKQLTNQLQERALAHQESSLSMEQHSLKLKAHLAGFCWPGFEPENQDALELALARKKALTQEQEKLEQQLKQQRQQVEKRRKDLERFQAEINKFKNEQAAHKAVFAEKKTRIQEYEFGKYMAEPVEHLQAMADGQLNRYEEIGAEYEQLSQELEALKEQRQAILTNLEIGNNDLDKLKTELTDWERAIALRLEALEIENLAEVREVLAQKLKVDFEKERIRDFKEKLLAAKTERATYAKQLAGAVYNAELHAQNKAALSALQSRHREQAAILARLGFDLERMKKDLSKRKRVEAAQQLVGDRLDNLKTLEQLFKGSGFVNYVSSIYLHELCRTANDRFMKLTRNQLSLEIQGDNQFVVRDMLNGGKLRSVKTLSGGQTFQASLSLALALADNIQRRHSSRHNFFFLDEGFGTLDRDSLSVVFDSLKQLRKEERVVGVISHVENLQQEIDVCLQVWKDEKKGSLVLGSWE